MSKQFKQAHQATQKITTTLFMMSFRESKLQQPDSLRKGNLAENQKNLILEESPTTIMNSPA